MSSQTQRPGAVPGAPPERNAGAQLPPLPIGRYRFTAVMERDLELPEFAGSMLRSVFGAALKRGACTTGLPECGRCPLVRACAYPAIFRTPARETALTQGFSDVPNPYVIEPPPLGRLRVPAGQALQWHQVLVGGETLGRLPLIVRAWERALRGGLGSRRIRGQLASVARVDTLGSTEPVYDESGGRLKPHQASLMLAEATAGLLPEAAATTDEIQLDFTTPLRLQREGRPLRPAELSPRVLVSQMLRRCNLMLDLHLGVRPVPIDAPALVTRAAALTDDRSALRWRDDARYSARQGQETPLGGVLGRWILRGDPLPELLPWLVLGQWLHLGKATVMGLGAYRLRIPAAERREP